MSYAVKEIYYTLQGEGIHAGRPAVFLRFTGCNLWSGYDHDRHKGRSGCSVWCDTDFRGTDGPGGGRFENPNALAAAVYEKWVEAPRGQPFVVCTGGEPLLQLDEQLVAALHDRGLNVAIETNGTRTPPQGIDWICVSPKAGTKQILTSGHELKLVFPQSNAEPELFENQDFEHFLLQPLDGPDAAHNLRLAVEHCLLHPQWRLSLQTQKLIAIR